MRRDRRGRAGGGVAALDKAHRFQIAHTALVGILVVGADQLSKFLAERYLAGGGVHLLGSAVGLRLVHNKGVAFGLVTSLIVPISIVGIMAILLLWRKMNPRGGSRIRGALAIGVLLGGAVGNLLDRVRLGYVVDFIDVWFWPTFNLADVAIVIGCVALVSASWKNEFRET